MRRADPIPWLTFVEFLNARLASVEVQSRAENHAVAVSMAKNLQI
jgi:hypothetical protein